MELTKKQIMNLEVVHELTPLEELEAQIDKSVAIIKKQNAIINRTDSKLYNFSNAAKLLGVIPQSEIDRINLK